uniref:LRRNT domain-containing protein n=1 Tax=Buteo japonicus TaxID=224669 RepID=A0A8C0BTW4_9AVES
QVKASMTCLMLILCMLLLLAPRDLAGACPTGCQCQDPKTILCAARRGQTLWAVPPLDLPNLLLLDISWNKIPTIAPGAFHAVNIESLKIAGLGLTSLNEELFQAQNNLHELDVSDNLLERVPAVLRRLGSLTKLSLAGNARISQLPAEDFHNLHNLQELDISNLNINTIPRDFSSFFPRLRAMTAAGNPFNCICQMSWLVQWVNASKLGENIYTWLFPISSGKTLFFFFLVQVCVHLFCKADQKGVFL